MSWVLVYGVIAWGLRVAMVPVLLRRQFAPGAAMAWLGIVFLHPYIGLALYLLVGETRLGPRRTERHHQIVAHYRPQRGIPLPAHDMANHELEPPYHPMVLQAEKISGMPIVAGNSVDLLPEAVPFVDRLITDIDAATKHVHLLYYIFATDSTGERVAAALMNAAARGVHCRLLVDAVASRHFLRNHEGMAKLKLAGIHVAAALPVALISQGLPRMDLRNHRKMAIIDDDIAYCGSHNVINADYYHCKVGPWVDLTARYTGPIVDQLAMVFCEDWAFETDEYLSIPRTHEKNGQTGDIPMQVVPTGPAESGDSFRRVLLAAIQSARSRLILTTPYFVPDEPTLVALSMAADRGVDVSLIVPQHGDHLFTAAAGRAHFSRLLDAGVAIHLFKPGLIHSKTATVDDAFALIGSANTDVRSFNLNFELSVLLYGAPITQEVRNQQLLYIAQSAPLDAREWNARPVGKRYAEGAIALLSPLL